MNAATRLWRTGSVVQMAAAVAAGHVRAVDLLELSRQAVERRNDELLAFVHLDWDLALHAARAVDADQAAGRRLGPLAGVPFGVKDTQRCTGMPTRYGSLLYADAEPETADDPAIARLRAAGAVPVGKTATPELASGLLTETLLSGTTRNPWNPDLTPGGSSGGSAAAVASGMVPFATGTDGGGSIRIPASICGLVGLKTSYGAVPERDRVPSQTSTAGVLTWTVEDTAAVLDVMVGPDPTDPASHGCTIDPPLSAWGDVGIDGLRVTFAPHLDDAGATTEVMAACRRAFDRLVEGSGLVDLPDVLRLDAGANEVFTTAGAGDPWALYTKLVGIDPATAPVTDHVRTRLTVTGAVSIPAYGAAMRSRWRLRRELVSWFDIVDVVVVPTLATSDIPAQGPPPTRVPGQRYEGIAAVAPLTRLANLAQTPAVTVPVGRGANGAPIGLSLMVGPGRDALALALGAAVERQGLLPTASHPAA